MNAAIINPKCSPHEVPAMSSMNALHAGDNAETNDIIHKFAIINFINKPFFKKINLFWI